MAADAPMVAEFDDATSSPGETKCDIKPSCWLTSPAGSLGPSLMLRRSVGKVNDDDDERAVAVGACSVEEEPVEVSDAESVLADFEGRLLPIEESCDALLRMMIFVKYEFGM